MCGSVAVPCFIAIGSHNLHVRHSFIMFLFLIFAVSFSSILRMISIPKVSLGVDEEQQVDYGVVCHLLISPVFTLGYLPLMANSCKRSSLFGGLVAKFVYRVDYYLSIMSSPNCRP